MLVDMPALIILLAQYILIISVSKYVPINFFFFSHEAKGLIREFGLKSLVTE